MLFALVTALLAIISASFILFSHLVDLVLKVLVNIQPLKLDFSILFYL